MISNVVGRGMLARVFYKNTLEDCLFFCSGVSKSFEKNKEEFDREKELLVENMKIHEGKCLVYFSSILSTLRSSEYYNHKFEIENYIAKNAQQYLIFRLPQAAGKVLNDTLFPFFVRNIYFGNNIKIFSNSTRCIVDVEDVYRGLNLIYRKGIRNSVIDFCPAFSFEPLELAQLIASELNTVLNFELVNQESIQICSPSDDVSRLHLFSHKDLYLKNIVNKYTPEIVELILHDEKAYSSSPQYYR